MHFCRSIFAIFFLSSVQLLALGGAAIARPQAEVPAATLQALERRRAEAEALAAQWTGESLQAAAAILQDVIAGARAAGANELAAQSLESLVRILTDDTARLALLREAIALREGLGQPAAAARNLVDVGALQSRIGQKDAAVATLLEALERLQDAGDALGEAQALNELGVIDYWRARYDDALARHQRALELFERAEDAEHAGFTLNFIARTYSKKGRDREALAIYQRAYDLAATLPDERARELARAPALANMANTHLDLGEADRAEVLLDEAAALAEDTPGLLAPVLTLRGKVRAALGEHGPALDDLQRVRVQYREEGNRVREANATALIGDVYSDLGDWDQALDQHRQALAIARSLGDKMQEGQIVVRVGEDLMALEQWTEAAASLREALALARTAGDRPLEARALLRLGDTQRALGDRDAALDALTRSLALQRAVGSRRGEGLTLAALGRLHADLGRRAEAEEHFDRALEVLRATGHRAGEARALHERAALLRQDGRLDEARRSAEAALDIVESLRGGVTSEALRTTLLASRQDYYERLVDTLLRLHGRAPEAGHDASALEVSERARARSLLDSLRERGADIREGVDASLLAQEEAVRRKLSARTSLYAGVDVALVDAERRVDRKLRVRSARQQKLTERSADPTELASVTDEIESLLEEHREIQRRIRAASPRYAALTQPPPAHLKAIQEGVIDDETALLEYFLGSERSVLWLVTRASIETFDLPPRRIVEDAARRYYERLKARSEVVDFETERERQRRLAAAAADLPEAGRALADLVLAPLRSARPGLERLLIVGHGALQYVPFAALPLPGRADQAPVLTEYEVVYAPSATVLLELRRDAPPPSASPQTIAVLADPTFGAAYPRLPHTRAEAQNITALVGKEHAVSALGSAASRAMVASPAVAQCDIVHLATHAFVDSQRPEMSGLVLSLVNDRGQPEDGVLRLHDIYGLKLSADLVVLSACQTALGKDVRGEGMLGLARGFMYAGARRVVASLWSSPDQATSVLMTRFYRNLLKRDLSPAAALRAAQLSLWRERRWAAYDWAGFIVQGDWR